MPRSARRSRSCSSDGLKKSRSRHGGLPRWENLPKAKRLVGSTCDQATTIRGCCQVQNPSSMASKRSDACQARIAPHDDLIVGVPMCAHNLGRNAIFAIATLSKMNAPSQAKDVPPARSAALSMSLRRFCRHNRSCSQRRSFE
mmetsp:Transcript_38767/g.70597  ORF Transcript_38767/g.70597 Transcript_38767/m.70597 type:complete len:143 (-) Transcript_38767:28-456(-)